MIFGGTPPIYRIARARSSGPDPAGPAQPGPDAALPAKAKPHGIPEA